MREGGGGGGRGGRRERKDEGERRRWGSGRGTVVGDWYPPN